jgi:glycosyltransferase involved in cell wall biosynthesis
LLAELHARGLVAPDDGTVLGAGSACGVDTSKFKPALISSSDVGAQRPTRVTIGFVGRICADKGVPELIQAVAQLRECGIDARLLLVGELEEPSVMEPWLGRDGAADWISIEGWRDDLPAVMRDMDVFCLPSHREGMPISILEAMATGLPVVTTTATGCRDLVVDGVNGVLVPIDDVEALARGLALLARDPNLRHQWGASGRAIVERDFESARVNERFVDFLAQQLGTPCEAGDGRGA